MINAAPLNPTGSTPTGVPAVTPPTSVTPSMPTPVTPTAMSSATASPSMPATPPAPTPASTEPLKPPSTPTPMPSSATPAPYSPSMAAGGMPPTPPSPVSGDVTGGVPANNKTQPPKGNKKFNWKLMLGGLAAVVLVVGAVAASMLVMQNQDTRQQAFTKPTDKPQPTFLAKPTEKPTEAPKPTQPPIGPTICTPKSQVSRGKCGIGCSPTQVEVTLCSADGMSYVKECQEDSSCKTLTPTPTPGTGGGFGCNPGDVKQIGCKQNGCAGNEMAEEVCQKDGKTWKLNCRVDTAVCKELLPSASPTLGCTPGSTKELGCKTNGCAANQMAVSTCSADGKTQKITCVDDSKTCKVLGASPTPGTGGGGGSTPSNCPAVAGASCAQSKCCATGFVCQGLANQEVCNQIPSNPSPGTTTPDLCKANGGECTGWLGFRCTYLTNGQCLENPTSITDEATARAYAGQCGQVDQVCVDGTDNGKLCGNFTIYPNCSGSPSNPPTSSPTPGVTPGPMCMSISMTVNGTAYSNSVTPKIGDSIQLTCGQVSGATGYIFRLIGPNNTEIPLQSTGATSASYVLSTAGQHIAQCQICTGANGTGCYSFPTTAVSAPTNNNVNTNNTQGSTLTTGPVTNKPSTNSN